MVKPKQVLIAIANLYKGNPLPALQLLKPILVPIVAIVLLLGTGIGTVVATTAIFGANYGQGDSSSSTGPLCTTQTIETATVPTELPAAYRPIFTKAAAAEGADLKTLITSFWVENGQTFPNPPPPYGTGAAWPVSGPGASGPFQFLLGTWASHAQDGNGDGIKDINDLTDAAYGAANLLADLGAKPGTPLGSVDRPYDKPSLVNVWASYDAGPAGNFSNSETYNYVRIAAGFYVKLSSAASIPSGSATEVSTTQKVCAPALPANLSCPDGISQPAEAYLLGTGLSDELAHVGLGTEVQKLGYHVAVNGAVDRTVLQAIGVLAQDADRITAARILFVEVGNSPADGTGAVFDSKITNLVAGIRKLNPTSPLYLFNVVGGQGVDTGSRNNSLNRLSGKLGFKVFDWFNLAYPDQDQYKGQPDASGNGWLSDDPAGRLPNATGATGVRDALVRAINSGLTANDRYTCAQGIGGGTPGPFSWPVDVAGSTVIQCFGPNAAGFHPGVDITHALNDPVYAAAEGIVIYAGPVNGYGDNFVAIRHPSGIITSYGHMNAMYVHLGQVVARHLLIGIVGSEGHSSGPHLHFNVTTPASSDIYNGNVDPLQNGLTIPAGVPNTAACV